MFNQNQIRFIPRFLLTVILIFLESSAPANQELEKVVVQLEWLYQFEYAGFIVAKEKGFYQEAGLDVELREYEPNVDNIERVLNRDVNYSVINSSLIVQDGKVVPTVLLASYLQKSPLVFVTKPSIKKPSDLIGKRIMGTTDEFKYSSLGLMLNHFFITPENTTIVEHTFSIEPFVNGEVDAMSAFLSNQIYELDKAGIEYHIIDPSDYGFIMNAVNLYSSLDETIENPERTRYFTEASNRGWQYALDHPEEVVDLIYNKYSQRKSREALLFEAEKTRQLMLLDFFPIGTISRELTERTYKQLLQTQILKEDKPFKFHSLKSVLQQQNQHISLSKSEQELLRQKNTLSLCVNSDQFPLEAVQNGQHIGMTADLVKKISELLDVRFVVHELENWKTSLVEKLFQGCDVISLVTADANIASYYDFTPSYMDIPVVIATRIEQPFFSDIRLLKNVPIGFLKGYGLESLLKEYANHLNLVPLNSIDEGLSQVENGNLYGYVDNLASIAYQIQKSYTGVIKVSGRLDNKLPLVFATTKQQPELAGIFKKVTDYLNQDENYLQNVYNRWNTIKFEQPFNYQLLFRIVLVIGLVGLGFLYHYVQLKRYNKKLQLLSVTDPLTQVYNRLKMDRLLLDEYNHFKRYQKPCGIMLLDIDHFKKVNDHFGHQYGDKILVEFANLITQNIRQTDKVCRWGGEEFLVICPNTNESQTEKVAEKVLNAIRAYKFSHGENLTASIGVGAFKKGHSLDFIIERVDTALYQVKNSGRNHVVKAEY